MIPAIAAIFLGVTTLAVMGGSSDESPRRHRRTPGRKPSVGKQAPARRAAVETCDVFPWLSDEVDAAVDSIPGSVGVDAGQVTLAVLRNVYPNTPAGEPIDWPSVPGDCPTIGALEERVYLRVAHHLAARADELADKAWYESGGR